MVAVIAILAALLLSVVSQAKGKATRIECVGNLRQLGIGLQVFLSDNHKYPALLTSTNNSLGMDRFWIGQLEQDGVGNPKLSTNFYYTGIWSCPSAEWSDEVRRGLSVAGGWSYYAYNTDIFDQNMKRKDSTNQFGLQGHYNEKTKVYAPLSETEVIAPADMVALGDGFEPNGILMRRPVASMEEYGNILTRHQGKANVVFCDGHVESPALKSLFEDTSETILVRWNRDHQPHRENL